MNVIPVLFEDEQLTRMRPLAWSLPTFEIRCGMFNTRERVDLATGDRGGVLLGRAVLAGLNTAEGWSWGPQSIGTADPDAGFLFINGLLAPDVRLARRLLEVADGGLEFVWRVGGRLVAAHVTAKAARTLAARWVDWETDAAGHGIWSDPTAEPAAWSPELPDLPPLEVADLADLAPLQESAPGWVWELVPATAAALNADLAAVAAGTPFRRRPFGIVAESAGPAPDWLEDTILRPLGAAAGGEEGMHRPIDDPDRVYVGEGVRIAAGTAVDTSNGPVILDRGVRVMPHAFLEGPLYVGPGSLVKPGTRLHGESSFGIVNRLAGEIGESTFGDFANKQHEGFIGHAVLGSWINLGAMTTCSDLKNNYGEIRVDLGGGPVATGSRFVGLMMGDHAKTAIGTLFNTGTAVGFASNIFGADMPPKFVGNFRWGGRSGGPRYEVDRARRTAEVVMSRRGCRFTAAHGELFDLLGG